MRRVCGCTPASSAATEIMYNALASLSIALPPVLRTCEQARARILVEHGRERFDGFALLARQIDGHLDLDRHEEVAARAVAVGAHTLTPHAQHLAARRSRRDPHR